MPRQAVQMDVGWGEGSVRCLPDVVDASSGAHLDTSTRVHVVTPSCLCGGTPLLPRKAGLKRRHEAPRQPTGVQCTGGPTTWSDFGLFERAVGKTVGDVAPEPVLRSDARPRRGGPVEEPEARSPPIEDRQPGSADPLPSLGPEVPALGSGESQKRRSCGYGSAIPWNSNR